MSHAHDDVLLLFQDGSSTFTMCAFQDVLAKQRLKEEGESLQENIDFVNEQIQECQLEIMQV